MTRSRALRALATLVAIGAVGLTAAANAWAAVTISPQAQCRGAGCLIQIGIRAAEPGSVVVRGAGRTIRVRVPRGTSRRLVPLRTRRGRFPVTARHAGTTARRTVRRRAFPVNRARRACATLGATGAALSVGPRSDLTRSFTIASRGAARVAVVFVDFRDAPGAGAPGAIVRDWLAPGARWLQVSSYGRFRLNLAPRSSRWLRMPLPSTAYAMADGVTYDEHERYIRDAIAVADPGLDFTGVDAVYVVASPGAAIPLSPTFSGVPGTFVADGRPLGPAVTFGTDLYSFGRTIVPHETGHMLGLPDLYAYAGPDQHRFVGVWDLMGNVFQHTDLTAWQRRNLDWLSPGQLLCAARRGTTWGILSPLGARGGAKALFVRTGRNTGIVVENRQQVANDRGVCRPGALVYAVNSAVDSGAGPIRVVGGDRTGNGCGYGQRSDATLRVGQAIRRGRVTVRVLGASGRRLQVSVTAR